MLALVLALLKHCFCCHSVNSRRYLPAFTLPYLCGLFSADDRGICVGCSGTRADTPVSQ
jgi:hypothetical protein